MHFRKFIPGKGGGFREPFLFFCFLILVQGYDLLAQEVHIIRNEDPIEYFQRTEIDNRDSSRIWDTVREFAAQLKSPGKVENDAVIEALSGNIKTQFGFYLYQKTAFLKQVEGAIFADLDIELQKDQVLTTIRNIYFIDYNRDRYGKFSPASSKKYALEDLIKTRKNDAWKQHFLTVDDNMRLLLSNMEKLIMEIKEASLK
jgi:hypothetical protein